MTNMKLIQSGVRQEDFIALGFIEETDGTDSPWGVDYNFRNEKFHILIDCTFEVKLCRLDVDSDYITIVVDNKFELEQLIGFIS